MITIRNFIMDIKYIRSALKKMYLFILHLILNKKIEKSKKKLQ